MRMTDQGLDFLAAWEGGVQTSVYLDVAGYPTIGVGHLITDGEDFSEGISVEEGMAMFRDDVATFEDAVSRHVTVPLKPHQFDALVSFCFNVGEGAFSRSTLLRRLNAGQPEDVPSQLDRWNKAGGEVVRGLIRRRDAEGQVFADGVYTHP